MNAKTISLPPPLVQTEGASVPTIPTLTIISMPAQPILTPPKPAVPELVPLAKPEGLKPTRDAKEILPTAPFSMDTAMDLFSGVAATPSLEESGEASEMDQETVYNLTGQVRLLVVETTGMDVPVSVVGMKDVDDIDADLREEIGQAAVRFFSSLLVEDMSRAKIFWLKEDLSLEDFTAESEEDQTGDSTPLIALVETTFNTRITQDGETLLYELPVFNAEYYSDYRDFPDSEPDGKLAFITTPPSEEFIFNETLMLEGLGMN